MAPAGLKGRSGKNADVSKKTQTPYRYISIKKKQTS